MRTRCLLVLLVLVSACRGQGRSPSLDADATSALDGVLQGAVEDGSLPGVVALVLNRDRVLYEGAFGVMDEVGQEPMQRDAIFQIFSMTKPITSVGVMMLVEEGSIGLDEPVSRYLEEFEGREVLVSVDTASDEVVTRPANRPVTVRDLLRHTSGIGYTFASYELQDWVAASGRSVLAQPLLHDPGSRWTYGASTYFLGRIIEEVSGESLDRFLTARILGPLEMHDTSYDLRPDASGRFVALYNRTESGLDGVAPPESYQPSVRGDGGLLSTADDYARFVRMILREGEAGGIRFLSPETIAQMATNQLEGITVSLQPGALPAVSSAFPIGAGRDGFGLGFQISAGEPGGRAPGSLSWAGLRNTHFWIDPETGLGVVFLTQVLPFYDDSVMKALTDFERTLYDHVE